MEKYRVTNRTEKTRRCRKNSDDKRIPRKLKKLLKKRVFFNEAAHGHYPKKIIYKSVADRAAIFELID